MKVTLLNKRFNMESCLPSFPHFSPSFSMAYQKALLKLEMKDVVLVKPLKSTPSSVLSLSTLDNIPDHDDLCQTVHVYRSAIHDSDDFGSPDSQLDPAYAIKEALSKALFYYHPLAGRLVKHADGKLRVNCSAEYGVPFLEATANYDLSYFHYLAGADTEIARHLVLDLPSQDKSCYQYPLVFMVTKFLCRGFTVGMGLSHSVCDGFGAFQFFRAIVELASGRSEPSVKPVWERERLVGLITRQPLQSPLDKESAVVSPFLSTTNLNQVCFKVEGEIIRRFKLSLMKESDSETMKGSLTTFESLAAYVWRSRAKALKLRYDGKTMLDVLVGVRRNFVDDSLPDGYYGNVVVDAKVVLTVRELNKRPLLEIVKLIKETKNVALTTNYIKNTINTLATKQEDFSIEETSAVKVLTEWKQLGFLENVDFGGKEVVNIVSAPCNMLGSVAMCIFSPPYKFDIHQ